MASRNVRVRIVNGLPMIEVSIVCTHDALKFAETLTRLLEAEQHAVKLHCGRLQAQGALDGAVAEKTAIVLVWSADAPSQHYMLEWGQTIPASRLVEVARAPGAPRLNRNAPVIEFTQWRGERGGRAWTILGERLRNVERTLFPPKAPPTQALMALGLASVAAVGGAFMVRVDEQMPLASESPLAAAELGVAEVALGGAFLAEEPPSIEDILDLPRVRFAGIDLVRPAELSQLELADLPELRDATLLERLSDLNPLRGRG